MAGTPEGDALLRHEAAHVAQQQDAARDPAQRGRPIGNEEPAAEGNADQAATQAAFGGKAGVVARTSVQVQRADPAKVAHGLDRARYRAIELQLKNLIAQKQGLVDGSSKGNMAAIDAEIDKLIGELRVDFGVALDRGKILDGAVADAMPERPIIGQPLHDTSGLRPDWLASLRTALEAGRRW